MTVLRCACGTVVEGTGDELLAALETHIALSHVDAGVDPGATTPSSRLVGSPSRELEVHTRSQSEQEEKP